MAEIYVYRSVGSTGARDLARALGGQRVKEPPPARRGDFVICWGSVLGNILPPGAKALNNIPIRNKYEDAVKLKEKDVPTIEVSLRQPQRVPQHVERAAARVDNNVEASFRKALELANDFVENDAPNFDSPVFKRGVEELSDAFSSLRNIVLNVVVNNRIVPQPAQRVDGEWLPRRFYHVGGKDLLNPRVVPQYYVKKEDIVEEFRVHSFLGKSLRAGRKVQREDVARPHAWIRSWDGGWRIQYAGVEGNPQLRQLAHSAVAALGLDFGAVDIGKLRDGRYIVLEVNRAPGIEGGTVEKYAEAVQRWMRDVR